MSRKEIYDALSTSTLPVAHMCFPEGTAPALPWVVFFADDDNVFTADDKRYASVDVWTVELYQKFANETTEALLETAMSNIGIFTQRIETWIEEEQCLMISYRLTQLRK